MEITDVVVHTLALPAVQADRADGTQDAFVIEIETDEGIVGIGEGDASPAVLEAIVEAPHSHDKSGGLRDLLIGRDPFDVEQIWNDCFDKTYFFGRKGAAIVAMSAVDVALWDIMGKATEKPIHKLLGGKGRESVRAYASTLFPDDPTNTDHMIEAAEEALDGGFTAIKFGWGGFGQDHRHDDGLLGAARATLGPDVDLMVDAGMIFEGDTKRAIRETNALDDAHDLYWMEEPVYADNYDAYATLADRCSTRIVGGEEEYAAIGFHEFLTRGNPDGLQPDVARSGGITHMNKIATLASVHGVPVFPHGYSTDIIIAANLQLIAAIDNAPLLEYCVEDSPLRWDVVEESFPVENGYVKIPDRPGLGITLNRDTLETYRTNR